MVSTGWLLETDTEGERDVSVSDTNRVISPSRMERDRSRIASGREMTTGMKSTKDYYHQRNTGCYCRSRFDCEGLDSMGKIGTQKKRCSGRRRQTEIVQRLVLDCVIVRDVWMQ